MDEAFQTWWEHYPSTESPEYYNIAEPSESTKVLALFAWRESRKQALEDAANVAEEYTKGKKLMLQDVSDGIAKAIRSLRKQTIIRISFVKGAKGKRW